MKLANIIYNCELVNHTKCEYCNYIKIDNILIDYDVELPTLYVGWNDLKLNNKDLNILNQELKENWIYWTFTFDEKKDSHIIDVSNFIKKSIYNYFVYGKYKYEYEIVDYISEEIKTTEDFIKSLPINIDKTYVYGDTMMYVLSENKIFGIDLDGCNYLRFDVEKIKEYCLSKSNISALDLDLRQYIEVQKKYGNMEYLKRFVVCII